MKQLNRVQMMLWQILYILLSTTWIFAPILNDRLSYRGSLISQYETPGQPYSEWFRLGDFLAGLMIFGLIFVYFKGWIKRLPVVLLLVAATGMMLDPILTTSCTLHGNICQETVNLKFILHAIETTITAIAIFTLASLDAQKRKKLVSIGFVLFQVAYGILFLTQLANQDHFGTASQFIYQCAVVVWIAWFVTDYLFSAVKAAPVSHARTARQIFALWTFINGIVAILISLAHIKLLGRIDSIYFAGHSAWFAQHGVLIGIIMIYLSRHINRGEIRARQILLAVFAGEIIKYSAITPQAGLLILYLLSFVILFALRDDFKVGNASMTWDIRFKDLAFMVIGLVLAASLSLAVLNRDNQVALIASRSADNFTDYVLQSDGPPKTRNKVESALLAHTASVFLVVSAGVVIYILFRPYRTPKAHAEASKIHALLVKYSNNSEDYFKIWPEDKEYFVQNTGFIAYKDVGNIMFALPDPISAKTNRADLISQFNEYAMSNRKIPVFLAVQEPSMSLYKGLNSLQIGANALINVKKFNSETSKNKWWRWKLNRAAKQGYVYKISAPPHSEKFLNRLKDVSDDWLKLGHQERGFALGYFDIDYMQNCEIHYLTDAIDQPIAFVNRLPALNKQKTASIDLLRFRQDATEAMPYLLASFIRTIGNEGIEKFDLGFVPFAKTSGQLQNMARILSSGRFSSKGLEQFKNKFEPDWQNNYLIYSGDLGDLAMIVANLESAMKLD